MATYTVPDFTPSMEGWKLVPVEPTPRMIEMARTCLKRISEDDRWALTMSHGESHSIKMLARWNAMLAAAPTHPGPEGAEDKHQNIHLYEGDSALVIRDNGNMTLHGVQLPELLALFEVGEPGDLVERLKLPSSEFFVSDFAPLRAEAAAALSRLQRELSDARRYHENSVWREAEAASALTSLRAERDALDFKLIKQREATIAEKQRVAELDHECQASMQTIANERIRAEAAESSLAAEKRKLEALGQEAFTLRNNLQIAKQDAANWLRLHDEQDDRADNAESALAAEKQRNAELTAERDEAVGKEFANGWRHAKDWAAERVRAEDAEKRVAALEGALTPFSDMAGEMFARGWDASNVALALDNPDDPHRVTAGDFFKVRSVLKSEV